MEIRKKFFHDYFDGQIIKEETYGYKMFKLMLTCLVSLFGLFCWLAGFCAPAYCFLLVFGMIWNFYINIDSKVAIVFCAFVSAIYFVVACNFRLFAHATIYIGFYIPFQMFAMSKKYYGGSFVQIKKEMTDMQQVVYVILAVLLSVIFYMFDLAVGARFAILDATSAALLVATAFLRNERYNEYYYYRMFALVLSIMLWLIAAFEYLNFELVVVAVMYISYLIYDVGTNVFQKNTYENEYMHLKEEYLEIENKLKVEQKIKAYRKSKKTKEEK
jgi:nicotinamide riboside transporter PnuC